MRQAGKTLNGILYIELEIKIHVFCDVIPCQLVTATDISEGCIPSFSGSSSVTRLGIMELLDPEDETNTII